MVTQSTGKLESILTREQIFGNVQKGTGILMFSFSNKHSWLRSNKVSYSIVKTLFTIDESPNPEKF